MPGKPTVGWSCAPRTRTSPPWGSDRWDVGRHGRPLRTTDPGHSSAGLSVALAPTIGAWRGRHSFNINTRSLIDATFLHRDETNPLGIWRKKEDDWDCSDLAGRSHIQV